MHHAFVDGNFHFGVKGGLQICTDVEEKENSLPSFRCYPLNSISFVMLSRFLCKGFHKLVCKDENLRIFEKGH